MGRETSGESVGTVRALSALALVAAGALASRPAFAQSDVSKEEARGEHHEAEEPPRPFVFAQDARTLPSNTAELTYYANFAFGAGERLSLGAEQLGRFGSIHQLEIEAGFLNFLSVRAVGLLLLSPDSTDLPVAGGLAVRARVLGNNRLAFQLTAEVGVVREFEGDAAIYGAIHASDDAGPIRVTFNVTVEHSFRNGADPINFIVQLGAVYRLTRPLWLGLEYIGEDLLAGEDPEHERGPRNLLGPTLVYSTLHDKLQVRAGALAGITHLSPDALVRMGLVFAF